MLIGGLLLLIIGMIIRFYLRRNQFPIRERAPKLALLQAMSFTCIILIPYITEILIDVNPNVWCSDESNLIPNSRMILKAFYTNFRIMAYVVFLFRIFVVYKSWKLSEKERKKLGFFRDESKVILVRLIHI